MEKDIRAALCDMGHEEAVLFDGPDFDDAIIGVTDEGQVIYDYDAMVKSMMTRDGISQEQAIEFIEYNTLRALEYVKLSSPETAPIVMHRLNIE